MAVFIMRTIILQRGFPAGRCVEASVALVYPSYSASVGVMIALW